MKTTTGDRKYTFEVPAGDWRVHVTRYEQPWVIIERGCNAVAQLGMEHAAAREVVKAVRAYRTGDGGWTEVLDALVRHDGEVGPEGTEPTKPTTEPSSKPTVMTMKVNVEGLEDLAKFRSDALERMLAFAAGTAQDAEHGETRTFAAAVAAMLRMAGVHDAAEGS